MDRYTDASQDRPLGLAFWALVALLMLASGSLARAAWAAAGWSGARPRLVWRRLTPSAGCGSSAKLGMILVLNSD